MEKKFITWPQTNALIWPTMYLGLMDGQVGSKMFRLILWGDRWADGRCELQANFNQVDENESTGKISLGLSVIVRVTLRDGAFHEVYVPIFCPTTALSLMNLEGYRIRADRELQRESCGFWKGQKGGNNWCAEKGSSTLWQCSGKLCLWQRIPCEGYETEDCTCTKTGSGFYPLLIFC